LQRYFYKGDSSVQTNNKGEDIESKPQGQGKLFHGEL